MSELLSPKVLEEGRQLATALLVSAKKARAGAMNEQALGLVVQSIHRAAEALFASTGGFALQFEGDGVALNGVELGFESAVSFAAIREALESHGVSSLTMKSPPSPVAIRKLVLLFQSGGGGGSGIAAESSVPRLDARLAPRPDARPDVRADVRADARADVRAVSKPEARAVSKPDARGEARPDAGASSGPVAAADVRALAVELYAKLFLAVREQLARIAYEREHPRWISDAPRIHPIRVVESLVELISAEAADLLRLAAMPPRATSSEAHAVNTAILAVALGRALCRSREELIDLGLAALFHAVAYSPGGGSPLRPEDSYASLARFVEESSSAGEPAESLRIAIVGEAAFGISPARHPHLFSRIVTVASAYARLVSGFATVSGERNAPLEVLRKLMNDRSGRLDQRLVDLLVTVLRAYPLGMQVSLQSGAAAVVAKTTARWDRPEVSALVDPSRALDPAREENAVAGTCRALGTPIPKPRAAAPAPEVDVASEGLRLIPRSQTDPRLKRG